MSKPQARFESFGYHSSAQALFEPAPCEQCRHAERCASESLACVAFALFAGGAGRKRWGCAPRQPTRELYARLLGADAA